MMILGRRADASPFSNRDDNTQDRAFVAAFDGARRRIRVATPNLNDDAAKRALLDAARRGVTVEVVLSEGFNDATDGLPGQGGTEHRQRPLALPDALARGRRGRVWTAADPVVPRVDGEPREVHVDRRSGR